MKIMGINKHLYMAPDDPAAGGGGGGGANPPAPPAPPEPPAAASYTQQQKDADEAKLRRRYEREIKATKKQLEEQAAELEAFKQREAANPLPPSIQPPAPGGAPPADGGRLELLEKRFARTEQELNDRVKAAEEAAAKEKASRLGLQRDQLLDDAIRNAGVMSKHTTQARRYFLSQVEWDDLEGEHGGWMFRTVKGNLVPIEDGVAEELPDNLKPSRMPHGGAGNTNGLPASKQRKTRELEEAKKKLSDLKLAYSRGGGKSSDMMAFTRQKGVVKQLERELTAPAK